MKQTDVWLEGWLSGELSASEMESFQNWLRNDARNRRIFLAAVAMDQELRAAYRLPRVYRLRSRRSILAIAGAVAVVLIGIYLMLTRPLTGPMSGQVVCGWTLSDDLVLTHLPAPGPGTSTITAPQGGKIKRNGSLVQLLSGTEVILSALDPDETTGDIFLVIGRLTASVQEQKSDNSSAPSRVRRTSKLSVETPCGVFLLEQGCKVELTVASFNSPKGELGKQVDALVLAGAVMPPDLVPRPVASEPMKAGTGIRLTRIGQGPITEEQIPTP